MPVGCVPSAAVAVSADVCLGEGVCPGGCLPRGGSLQGVCVPREVNTSPCGQTDDYENITFLKLLLRMLIKENSRKCTLPLHI